VAELTRKAARAGTHQAKCRQLGSSSIVARGDGAPNLAPLTYARYESHVKNYIEPDIGALRLDRLRVADAQAWLNRLTA
jgi:hypothetical protein